MRNRIRYLPTFEATQGMVLAEPTQDRHLRNILPTGHTLSQENLQQLIAHQVELVCITVPDVRRAEEVALEVSQVAKRVLDTFEHADLSDTVTAALFNQVLTYRSA